MNKIHFKYWRTLITFIILAVALFIWLSVRQSPFAEIIRTYTENEQVLDNPARGYYIQCQANEYSRYEAMEQDGIRLALLAFDIKKYADQEIPNETLDVLRQNLLEARKHHITIIFRAAYGFFGECEEPAVKEGFSRHIKQISQILNEFKDIVISVQAGLLGSYGEWHHSAYLSEDKEAEASNKEIRLYILSQWEEYLDQSIPVAVRRPRFIREAYNAGILSGRLGYHNDGLLGSESDLGTYDDPKYDRESELKWMDAKLLTQINGGEMPIVSQWNDPENADHEFSCMHISYLNSMYNIEVLDKWNEMKYKSQNAGKYISNHLGYRLFIQEISAFDRWRNGKVSIKFKIANSGYGTLPEKYKLYLVIKGNGSFLAQKLEQEELYKISCGRWTTAEASVEIPDYFLQDKDGSQWQIGIKIAEDFDQTKENEWIKLANDGFAYKAGIYETLTYEYHKDKDVYLLK